jgi:HlyD family secretion protein
MTNAQTAEKWAKDQSAANKARQDEAEREFLRKLALVRTGSGTERDLTQAQALRDAGAADLRASVEQIQMKAEAIAIAEAEKHMAEANLVNAEAVVEQRQAAVDQAELDLDRTVLRAPIDGIIIKRDVNPGQTVAEPHLQRTGSPDPQSSRGHAKRRDLYDNRFGTKSGPPVVAGNDRPTSNCGE